VNYKNLKEAAAFASRFSYAPYSGFHVGAALLCADGSIFTGCNIENRSYSLTICAERSAVSTAAGCGKKEFTAVAVYCADSPSPVPPCGACRQVLSEFCSGDTPVFYAGSDKNFKMMSLGELYPEDSLHELKKE
jgi:cytidine deaminase